MPVGHLLILIPAGSAELGCFILTGDVPEGLLWVEMCLEGSWECWKRQGRADEPITERCREMLLGTIFLVFGEWVHKETRLMATCIIRVRSRWQRGWVLAKIWLF